jgi:hypothetical protein
MEIYKNKKFVMKNLVKFYENNVRSEWEMSVEKWMPVIRRNVAVCDKISEFWILRIDLEFLRDFLVF